MHGGGREGPAADMHGSREGRAMQGSSSKDQLQQCMAAAERGQLLTCMATVERGELGEGMVGTSTRCAARINMQQLCGRMGGMLSWLAVPMTRQCHGLPSFKGEELSLVVYFLVRNKRAQVQAYLADPRAVMQSRTYV
mmetsp:Transcript_15477/g.45681  ORF Transcript_15477/g.45681 Transcript_15477/m.45681 type:complete len:138 (-) Transcript_15477:30-443(-)